MYANILNMRSFLYIFLIILFLYSCKEEPKTTVDTSNIAVNVTVDRFDVDFYTTTPKTLAATKKKYPLLFPAQEADSVWLRKINDKDELELFTETQKLYKDFSTQKKELERLFKHVKYYNPKFTEPKVITMLSNIDYNNRVIYADSLLLISLDAYLGKDHKFYGDYPKYIKENNTKEHIVVDVASTIINKQVMPNLDRSFLAKMIYQGKKMYLLDAYLPTVSDREKIGYTPEKNNWALANEEQIWRYFIENKLLYSTNTKLNKRFLEKAPFSKFYLEQDNQSPGQIGVYMGWQIVRAYMRNNNVSLRQLLQANAEEIFKKSRYKPKR